MSKSRGSSRKGSISKLKQSLDKEIPLNDQLFSAKKDQNLKIDEAVIVSKRSSKKSTPKQTVQETFAERFLRTKHLMCNDKTFNLNLSLNLSGNITNTSSAGVTNDSSEDIPKHLQCLHNDVISKGKLSENSKRSQSQDIRKSSTKKKIEGSDLGFNFSPLKNLVLQEQEIELKKIIEAEEIKETKENEEILKEKTFKPNNSDRIFYEDDEVVPEIIKKEKKVGPGRAGVKATPYCVYEDNLILERFATKGEKEAMNSCFKSIENVYSYGNDIPASLIKRTFESIKTRYTKTLKQLSEEDAQKIKSYCEENYNNEPLLLENQAVIIRESKNDLQIKEISLIPYGKDKTITAIDNSDSSSIITADNIQFSEILDVSSKHQKKISLKKIEEEIDNQVMEEEVLEEKSLIEQLGSYQTNHEIGLVNMCEDSEENLEDDNENLSEQNEMDIEEPQNNIQSFTNVRGYKLDPKDIVTQDDILDSNPMDFQEKTGFNSFQDVSNNVVEENDECSEEELDNDDFQEDCEQEAEEESEEHQDDQMNNYQSLKRAKPEASTGFNNLSIMYEHESENEDKKDYFNADELKSKAKALFKPGKNLKVSCAETESIEYKSDGEDEIPASPEFNYSNAEVMEEVDQTNLNNKKIFSNYMGINREAAISNRVENFESKINSSSKQDREDVAYTVASFIISLSKTLGYPVKDYIQHLCGNGIPSDMAKVRDQILSLKVSSVN